MADINLLPQDLRHKKESKERKPAEARVEFVHHQEQGQPLEPPAQKSKQEPIEQKIKNIQSKQSRLKLSSIIKKIKNLPQALKNLTAKPLDQKQDFKKKSGGLSVDLLKEEITLQRSPKPELIKLFITATIIALITTGIVFAYKYQYKNIKEKIAQLQKESSDLDQKSSSLERAAQSLVKDSDKLIRTVDILLKNRIDWLAFLAQIENITLKDIYYTNLKASSLSSISISARAKSMEDALLQVKIFKNSSDFVAGVELKNMSVEEETVTMEKDGTEESFINSFVDFSFEFNVQPAWIIKNRQS
jgi:predicted nuclease with TOPRIM domain